MKPRYYWNYERAIWVPRDWGRVIRASWDTPENRKTTDRICYGTCAAAFGWLAG